MIAVANDGSMLQSAKFAAPSMIRMERMEIGNVDCALSVRDSSLCSAGWGEGGDHPRHIQRRILRNDHARIRLARDDAIDRSLFGCC